MSELLSKDNFFTQEERKLKKENPKIDAKKLRAQLSGRWEKYQLETKKTQKLDNKKLKDAVKPKSK